MTVQQWRQTLDGVNLTLVLVLVACLIWLATGAPTVQAVEPVRIETNDVRDALGTPEAYRVILDAVLQPREKKAVVRREPPPPRVDHDRIWIEQTIRVTTFVPKSIVYTVVVDGAKPRRGELWFVTDPARRFTRAGRTATLKLERIDRDAGRAHIRWIELRRVFVLGRTGVVASQSGGASGGGGASGAEGGASGADGGGSDDDASGPEDLGTGGDGAGGRTIRLTATRWLISGREAREAFADSATHLGAMGLVPHASGGAVVGLRLGALPADSLAARRGFKTGDVVIRVNQFKVTRLDQLPELQRQLKNERMIRVFLLRSGREMTLQFRIRR